MIKSTSTSWNAWKLLTVQHISSIGEVALMLFLYQLLINLKFVTWNNLEGNIKPTLSAAVTTEATLSLLKFCNPEIICKGCNLQLN